jgi:hypothetical protein
MDPNGVFGPDDEIELEGEEETAEKERSAARMARAGKRLCAIASAELRQKDRALAWWIGREALEILAEGARRFADLRKRSQAVATWTDHARLATRLSAAFGATGKQAELAKAGRMALLNWRDGLPSEDGPAQNEEFSLVVDFVSREYEWLRAHPCRCGGDWKLVIQRNTDRTDTPDGYLMHDELNVRCDFCAARRSFFFKVKFELETGAEDSCP